MASKASSGRALPRSEADRIAVEAAAQQAAFADLEAELDTLELAERQRHGRTDPAWWLRYYLPESFPARYGQHHLDIIEDFRAIVDAVAPRPLSAFDPAAAADWWDIDTSPDDDDQELTAAEWADLMTREPQETAVRQAAYACPRGFGKSTIFEGLILWAICYGLFRFLVIVSKAADQSKLRLEAVKAQLEANERIRADYGDLTDKRKWTETDIVTSTGIRVRAYGTLSNIRGAKHGCYRPDLVLVDDGEKDEHVLTEPQRQKTRDWFTRALMPTLDPDRGVMIVNGTILHHDSLLARLTGQEHFRRWRKRVYRALITAPDSKLRSLWPSVFPVPRLLHLRSPDGMGLIAFNCEFQNEPISEDTTLFRLEWLRGCRDVGRPFIVANDDGVGPDPWEQILALCGGVPPICVLSAWDFGWVAKKEDAEARDSNYTATVAYLVHPVTRWRYVLGVWRDRGLTPSQVKAAISEHAGLIRPPAESGTIFRVAVENVGLQKQLYEVGVQEETDLPVVGITTGREKADVMRGVPSLSKLIEGGQIRFPWPAGDDPEARRQRELVQALINELHGLGSEAHDDFVMALWFAEVLAARILRLLDARMRRAGRKPDVIAPARSAAAWLPPASSPDSAGAEAKAASASASVSASSQHALPLAATPENVHGSEVTRAQAQAVVPSAAAASAAGTPASGNGGNGGSRPAGVSGDGSLPGLPHGRPQGGRSGPPRPGVGRFRITRRPVGGTLRPISTHPIGRAAGAVVDQ